MDLKALPFFYFEICVLKLYVFFGLDSVLTYYSKNTVNSKF